MLTIVVYKPSDFAIINTDANSDFDVENKLVLRDPAGRKLDLKLNYVYVFEHVPGDYCSSAGCTGITRTRGAPSRCKSTVHTSF